MRVSVGALALILTVAGCQAPPTSLEGARPTSPDTAALAAQALERGDYARAAELYRSALAAAPDSLPLHFGLGVSASYLEQKSEAVRELIWVLEHGDAGSNEVRVARRWLASVGALPRSTRGATPDKPDEQQDRGQTPATATVQGRVVFGEAGQDVAPRERMQLFLMEHPTRVRYFRLRTDEQGHFRFQKVPPGVYKLTERAAGQPTWRLRVELKAGEDRTLDLTPANSTRVRDDFPDLALAVGSESR
ncbi:MAG TPA: carboxypeptidase regulatory-like domain-containing protein [Methylomirabilota bacterium]|jgi:hypothetical protein|nr:carboxypeptidase regulatory-like domain-containing protein [Methylomirabilota bacterium]